MPRSAIPTSRRSSTSEQGGSALTAPAHVGDYQQFDLMAGADLGKTTSLKVARKDGTPARINNAFNKMPPVAQNAFPATNADVGDYNGPIGRLYYVEARYRY